MNKYRLSPHKSLQKNLIQASEVFSTLAVTVIYPRLSPCSSNLWGGQPRDRTSIPSEGKRLCCSPHCPLLSTHRSDTRTPSLRSLHCQLGRNSFNHACGGSMLFRNADINLKHYMVSKLEVYTWNNTPSPSPYIVTPDSTQ